MEITCKAFNVDLHRTVTLKVIIEKYVGDESATVRLLAYLEGISICILSISHMSTIVARETQIRIRLSYLFIISLSRSGNELLQFISVSV
jgi:hypothetical protein